MLPKVQEKEKAISLRKKGYSYGEIMREVNASKSSISLWLKDTPLTDEEKKIIKRRKNADPSRWRIRAAASRKAKQDQQRQELFESSKLEFYRNLDNALFQVGISLYWAEGAKRNTTFSFINSDPDMIKLMLNWVRLYLVDSEEEIRLRVFTHKAFEAENHEKYWSLATGIPLSRFGKTIYKTQNGLIVKKRPYYHGCIRIELGKVKYLRKVLFWQQLLIGHHKA